MSPAAKSQIVTCCMVLNVTAPVAASACVTGANVVTEIETIFVTLRVDVEMASRLALSAGKNDVSHVRSMSVPHLPIAFDYHPLFFALGDPRS